MIDCIVRNLSSSGALLVLPSVFGVPETFDLLMDSDGSAAFGSHDLEGTWPDGRGVWESPHSRSATVSDHLCVSASAWLARVDAVITQRKLSKHEDADTAD